VDLAFEANMSFVFVAKLASQVPARDTHPKRLDSERASILEMAVRLGDKFFCEKVPCVRSQEPIATKKCCHCSLIAAPANPIDRY
jgi:hypothetical protein